ncbi:TKL protein kinase [Aphanomyces invadans]|uniref:TKL protein kinase n=1 Tax=Aphanomyces invadans TaxID=157072 RepID=A0A024TE61_9STRA|nr:TKL protein kinase [Aphanomyces invadans]ETV91642.1 TKL protein kinase [Aphanomyces invadans]|eukprot:XP_008879761.1 TKL protein kinase [Aphanomyces invadans]
MAASLEPSQLVVTIVKICCQVLSSCGALFMLLSLRNSPTTSSKILCFTAMSDFIFSTTGALFTIARVLDVSNWAIHIFLGAPHWSFEISSFLWTATLVLYILSRQARHPSFEIAYAHAVVWTCVMLYMALESYALLCTIEQLNKLARIIWDAFAVVTLVTVSYGLCAVRAHKLRTGQLGQSIILGKLVGYMLLFVGCVTPNITNDVLSLALPPSSSPDTNATSAAASEDSIPADLFGQIASVLFALWPLGTSLVYSSRLPWCSPLSKQPSNLSHRHHLHLMLGPQAAQSSRNLPPPKELVGLEIGPQIGQGIAVVYKGTWRGAVVAVKMKTLFVDDDALADAAFVHECNQEIQEEALVMKRLTHPNIVLFMEAGFYHGSICIVSEYCARGSLRDVLRSPLLWPMKIRLALGLAYGLQYLHNSRMIHRDLKSPNILVDETWHAKIADFGTLRLAEIVRNQNPQIKSVEMTGLVGTTRWMAPEVIQSKKLYTEKIDIYSLGVILWEMIDGKELPYEQLRWNHEIERAILDGKRPSIAPHSCPPRWKVLIHLCWHVEPTERPTIGELIRSLQRVATEDIKDIRHPHVPFVGNLQQMDCDYILKYTRCDVDYDNQHMYATNSSSVNTIALLEDTSSSSMASQSAMYTM